VRFKPLDFSLDYTRISRRWVRNEIHDYNHSVDLYGARLDFKVFDRLKPYLRGEFHRIMFDGDLNIPKYHRPRGDDEDDSRVLAGLVAPWSESLSWEVAVGWQRIHMRDYHPDLFPDEGARDSDHLLALGQVTWHVQPEGKLDLTGFFRRGADVSLGSGYNDTTSVGVQLSRKWDGHWKTHFSLANTYFNRPHGTDFTYQTGSVSVLYRINKWASLLGRYERVQDAPRNAPPSSGFEQNKATVGGLFAW
jgi:hypothetical protein